MPDMLYINGFASEEEVYFDLVDGGYSAHEVMGQSVNISSSLYHQKWGRARRKEYWEPELQQPEYQLLVVTKLHAETEKSYCVSGFVNFENEYRGMLIFEMDNVWLPKSQCVFTGQTVRVPQWIIRSRWQKQQDKKVNLDSISMKAESLLSAKKKVHVPPWEGSI